MSYEDLLAERCAADDRTVVMTAENRAAIRGLEAKIADRFIDVGIAEQTMIGAAAGLALRGRRPVTHALATFIAFRAYEFIRDDVAIPGLPVVMVGGVPGFLSDANGPTHQALEDVALMRGLPNVRVFCPADGAELVEGMRAILDDDAPWYVRYNALAPSVEHREPFTIGRAETLRDGDEITILTYGFLVRECAIAADILAAQGRSVRLLNMRTLKPVDTEAIIRAARETSMLVTVEDHFLTGGLFSIVAETFAREGVAAPVLPIALEERWFKPALLPDVLEYEGFTGAKIAERIMSERK